MSHAHWLFAALKDSNQEFTLPDGTELASKTPQAWAQLKLLFHLSDQDLALAVATSYGLSVGDFGQFQPNRGSQIPESLCRSLGLLPLFHDGDQTIIGTADPRLTQDQEQQLRFAVRGQFKLVILPPDLIDTGLTRLFSVSPITIRTKSINLFAVEANDNQTVQLAKAIFRTAIEQKASDIHLHPFVGGGAIRFRIDGLLQRIGTLPMETMEGIHRYLKAQAGLDPNPHSAQDGRMQLRYGEREVDMRLSFLPLFDGIRIVCRLLEQGRRFSLSQSGFATADYQALRHLISHGAGIVLLTGPTGSGKTSTLYALLSELNQVDVNIMTLEDPVEYIMPGISQAQINEAQGLSFSDTLRAILRQDPDILLVGEIRDGVTAGIAAQAALTGHMVLSTLHTNDAISTIPRLLDLRLDASVLADALVGVVAQRLVRKLCDHCKQAVTPPLQSTEAEFLRIVGEQSGFRPVGCDQCHYTGFAGRLPIIEIMEVSPNMRVALLDGIKNISELTKANKGYLRPMSQSAAQWIVSGNTTPQEVQRVLGIRFWNELSTAHQVALRPVATYQDPGDMGNSAFQVLLLSRDTHLAKELSTALTYPIERVDDELQAADYLQTHHGVIGVIIDAASMTSSPPEWLGQLRAKLAWSGLPVLFVVPEHGMELQKLLKIMGAPYIAADVTATDKIASAIDQLLNMH